MDSPVALIACFIGFVHFAIGMITIKKWFTVRNVVFMLNSSLVMIAKQLAEAISLLNKI